MNEALKFVMGLIDEVTSPARAMDSALVQLEKRTQALDKANKITGAGLVEFAAHLASPATMLGDLASGAGVAAEAIAGLAVSAVGLAASGYVMAAHAADFERSTLISLDVLEGSHEAAQETLRLLHEGANNAAIPLDKISNYYQELRELGASANVTRQMIAAAMDAETIHKGGGDKLLSTFDKLTQRGGQIDKKELRGSGLSIEDIASTLNTTGGATEGLGIPIIRQMLEKGQIDAVTGTQAILDTIRSKFDNGAILGTLNLEKTTGDVGDQLQVVKNNFEQLLGGAIDTGPAVESLHRLAAVLDVNTASGKAIQETIGRAFAAIGDVLTSISQPGKLDAMIDAGLKLANTFLDIGLGLGGGFIDAIMDSVGPLVSLFSTSAEGGNGMKETFRAIGEVVGWCVGIIIDAVAIIGGAIYGVGEVIYFVGAAIFTAIEAVVWAFGALIGGAVAFAGRVTQVFFGFGGDMADGIEKGLTDAWDNVVKTFERLLNLLPDVVRDKLGIHSPSLVMMELGMFTGQGFADGITAQNDNAMAAMAQLVTPPSAPTIEARVEAPAAGTSVARGGNTYNITINADGAGAHDPRELARMVVAEIRKEMASEADDIIAEAAA